MDRPVPVDLRSGLELGEQPFGDQRRLVGSAHAVEEDRELVAPEARDGVGGTDRSFEPARHLEQHGVAGLVPEAVIDGLEVVEVDEHDGDQRALAYGRSQRMADAIGEQRAVGKIRDRIVECLMGQLLLERLALADIAAVQHDPLDVLVLEQLGVLDLELEPAAVMVTQGAVERMRLGPGTRPGAGHRLPRRERRLLGAAHRALL